MGRSGVELPVLVAQSGLLNGQRWFIDRHLMIGRDSGCDLIIPDRQVSRYHARLTRDEDGVLLEDLGSKNGTYYNGDLLSEPVLLQDGGVIQIAMVQHFIYLSSDATMPLDSDAFLGIGDGRKLMLDMRARRVWIGKKEVLPALSISQFKLLQVLYEQPGKVVERSELISGIWGDEGAIGVSEQALDALIRRLRERLKTIDDGHEYLLTVRGHGLRLDNPEA
jgi:pSer/pThr/pTyr-binding forkhead associated (FHA) protein